MGATNPLARAPSTLRAYLNTAIEENPLMHDQPLHEVIDLTEPARQLLTNATLAEARAAVASGDPLRVRGLEGDFALVAREGEKVRLARSLSRPLRYFLAKGPGGPVLFVAERIDTIRDALSRRGFGAQFHPSYTRMVPAHHVLTLRLVGCPDPNPTLERFFTPRMAAFEPDEAALGRRYAEAAAREMALWLDAVDAREPIGVAFSGGADSGMVLLLLDHVLRAKGMSPARLKAFTLAIDGRGDDLAQARAFLERCGMSYYHEPVEVPRAALSPRDAVRATEDYKPLDLQAATMTLALCRGIRERYPEWKLLVDGDGGDENFKDYPLEPGAEVTIRSVLSNPLLYHEGWGVNALKHSATYSGGLSRGITRSYATAAGCGFSGFSPLTRPAVVEAAEGIPFVEMTGWKEEALYALKGRVVAAGVRAVTGREMPVFPKRRFQEGAAAEPLLPEEESAWRELFRELYG